MAASERGVVGAALGPAAPAAPRAVLEADRAGRVAVLVRVRIGVGKTADRRVASRPARQLDPERGIEAAHIPRRAHRRALI